MKAKLTVLSASNINRTKQYFKEKINLQDLKPADLEQHPENYYGYALALFISRDYQQAIKLFKKLHQSDPANNSYIVALAKSYIASDDPLLIKKGMKLLVDTLKNRPSNIILTINYAYALIQSGEIKQGIEILENYNKDNFKHPAVYKLLYSMG